MEEVAMTTNSEARKRHEERQANCVCNPGDHCWSCGQPQGHSDNAVRPDDSVSTIEISREDAEYLLFLLAGAPNWGKECDASFDRSFEIVIAALAGES